MHVAWWSALAFAATAGLVVVGVKRLQELIQRRRAGEDVPREARPGPPPGLRLPSIPRLGDPSRPPDLDRQQLLAVLDLDPAGGLRRPTASAVPDGGEGPRG